MWITSVFTQRILKITSILTAKFIQYRMDKCMFGYEEGEFVGHSISVNGHRPVPRLVEKIKNAPKLKTKKEVFRFLGLANYYREHVPKFAETA